MAVERPLRIAGFGFRSIPPNEGCAGADKYALELYPRLAARGHHVVAYNRLYPGQHAGEAMYRGVHLKYFTTVRKDGFDALLHSLKVTWDIIVHNTADVVHFQGANGLWSIVLRMFGKRVIASVDGTEWARGKWSWHAKAFIRLSALVTAYIPQRVIIDNVFTKKIYETMFGRTYDFIPFGCEVPEAVERPEVFERLGITPGEYFLFVGRFIPDKGLHHLVPAFEKVRTDKKLVLVGGSPNPSAYEQEVQKTTDPRILFPGFIYGDDTIALMKHAYAYIQPSDLEGLSPVMLTVIGLGTPLLCSDIQENVYLVQDRSIMFRKGDPDDLADLIRRMLADYPAFQRKAADLRDRIRHEYSWETVTDQHVAIFRPA